MSDTDQTDPSSDHFSRQYPSATNFVLVHGGMHGGWCWRHVASALRNSGHQVFTPTLTGLGERSHLLNDEVSLGMWIADIVGVIESEELTDVVLVGHSFGAIVLLGVADKIAPKIQQLVALDGAIVPSGQSAFDVLPSEAQEARRESLKGLSVPPYPPAAFGVTDPLKSAWLARRLTPHPSRTFFDRLELEHPLGNGLPCTYIACTAPQLPSVEPSWKYVRETLRWDWAEIEACHDAMISDPELVVESIYDAVSRQSSPV